MEGGGREMGVETGVWKVVTGRWEWRQGCGRRWRQGGGSGGRGVGVEAERWKKERAADGDDRL